MRIRVLVILGTASALVFPASAQVGMFRTSFNPPYAMGAITGMPYSAEQVSESWQTLADGTRISRPTITSKRFRDSAGRTREERPIMITNQAREEAIVEIYDVVTGYRYILDPVNKVAHRSAIPPRPQMRAIAGVVGGGLTAPAAVARPAAPKATESTRLETTSESLGTQIIEGLTCEGKKASTTYPIGTWGNDRPMTLTNETWMSTELRIMVLSKNIDLLRGNGTVQLKNISRVEPEFSLFQPPPDYKIVDETGSFDLVIKMP